MRKISSFIAAATLAVGLSHAATAADLPRKAPPAPPPPPPPTWTGCYIGVNVGAAWGRFELDTFGGGEFHRTNVGFAGGGQFGCDYQFAGSGLVLGFRNMFDGTTNHRDAAFNVLSPAGALLATGTADLHNRWFDALTARVGYSWQWPWLVYFQGGAVWSRVTADVTLATAAGGLASASFSDTKTGWTVGGGVEYRWTPQWSVFLEGNYYDFGSHDHFIVTPIVLGCAAGCAFSTHTKAFTALAGVNYRFWAQ
jgi:outer membrane immunogenic protein